MKKSFVSGICAGNYDVKEIFIDSTLKAVDVQDLECFIKKLDIYFIRL